MFSIRFMLGLGVGAVAGYGVSRALEARSAGVPLRDAFKLDLSTLLTPVDRIRRIPKVGPGLLPAADPWANITPIQRERLDAFEQKYPGMTPSLRPVA